MSKPEEFAEKKRKEQDLDDVLSDAADADEKRRQAAELKKLTAQETKVSRYLSVLEAVLHPYEPTPLAEVPKPPRKAPQHEWLLVLSDWHIGQQTKASATGGTFYQDIATTRKQVARLWKALAEVHQLATQSQKIEKIHALVLGDIVEGDDMRPSQHRKVEELVTVQTIYAFDCLAWFLRQLLQIVEVVEVDFTGGNHDRLGKPGDAALGELGYEDTFAWLLGAFLQRMFSEEVAAGRIVINNWSSYFGFKEAAGLKAVFEHGASFRWAAGGYGGVPWYAVSNAGPRYKQLLGEADLTIIGHGHRSAILPTEYEGYIVCNGALPATSSYIQSGLKVIRKPTQWLLSLHKDIGVASAYPLYADLGNIVKPRDVWSQVDDLTEKATALGRPE